MKNKIQFFQVYWHIDYFDIFLNNAITNNINLQLLDQKTNLELPFPGIEEMYDKVITDKETVMIRISKGALKSKLELSSSYMKLYPETPFEEKLHYDEKTPSIDYASYLELLLELGNNYEIYALGTKENLYDYCSSRIK